MSSANLFGVHKLACALRTFVAARPAVVGVHELACALGTGVAGRGIGNWKAQASLCIPKVCLSLYLILAAPAHAADTVTLKDEVYVKGPTLTLEDIARIDGQNAAALAAVEVSPAAIPGGLKHLNAALIRSRIESAGLDADSVTITGAPRVTATTMHLDITREMIAADLRQYIELNMPWNVNDAAVVVDLPLQSYIVPEGLLEFRWRPSPQWNFIGPAAVRGELVVDGRVERTFTVRARVDAFADVVVAAADIPRGEPLTQRNLRIEKRDLSQVEDGFFFDLNALDGFLAKTNHFAGQLITARKVMPPTLVKRNQLIAVETTVGSMTIQGRAKALTDGAAGDVIRCENTNSNDQFTGVVREDGVVVVQ